VNPREGCPAWCTKHDDEHGQHHVVRDAGDIRVSIRQIADPLGDKPTLYVANVPVNDPAGFIGRIDVWWMAHLMRRLGREDVAAAVEELAALVAAGVPA